MKNIFKHILTLSLVLIFVLTLAMPQAVFADSLPYLDDYQEVSIKVNGKSISTKAFTIKGNIYIKTSTLKKYGDTSKLNINNVDQKITFKASELSLNLGNSDVTTFVKENAGECYIPIKKFAACGEATDYYVSIGPIAQIAKLAWSYSNGTLLLSQYSKSTNLATTRVLTDTAPSLKNKSIASLSTGEKVFIIKESESFYKVESLSGNQYYVNKSEIAKADETSEFNDFEYIATAKDTFKQKINIAWENLAETAVRTPLPPNDIKGVDVLCPVWLHSPANQNGYVRHLCDYGYVQLAHDLGYKVWMCANNSFTESGTTKYTTEVLASEKLSNKVIAQYLLYACMYNVDGIDIDYETLVNDDKANFTKFNQKLGKYCDQLGLTFSIAVYPYSQSNSNKYDFEKLGECADYIAPMMYANTTSNVNVQSISSYSWYSDSVDGLIKVVPANKVLLGVPLFTRYWYINSSGKVVDSNNYKAYTGTIEMNTVMEKIKGKSCSKDWDDNAKQYILTYPSDTGYDVRMWIEDERSMAERLKYVLNRDLAGTACWALRQESEGLLDIFDEVFVQGIDPQSILDKY